MLARFIPAAILTLSVLPVLAGQSLSRDSHSSEITQSGTATQLSLRFIDPAHAFASDAALEVEVELRNEGTQTVLVCRDLRLMFGNAVPCAWEFSVRYPAGGEPHEGCASAADKGFIPKGDFASALIKDWIALAPGYSYRTHIDLLAAFCGHPPPGRYEIAGILTSSGIDGQSINNDLRMYPDEIRKLPYPGWKGTIRSNKIWITVEDANRTH
jgi:hypothetical protein